MGRAPAAASRRKRAHVSEPREPHRRRTCACAGLESLAGREADVERAIRDLMEAMGEKVAVGDPARSTPTRVPMLTEDGTLLGRRPAGAGALRPHRRSSAGAREQTTRRLALLERLVERAQETTGADWVGIYQRRANAAGVPVLVKLAYVGPSEPRRVSAHARVRRAQHQQHGGPHRARHRDRRRGQARRGGRRLLRLRRRRAVGGVRADPRRATAQVVGIVDAEAKPKGFFGGERLAVIAALAIVGRGGAALVLGSSSAASCP